MPRSPPGSGSARPPCPSTCTGSTAGTAWRTGPRRRGSWPASHASAMRDGATAMLGSASTGIAGGELGADTGEFAPDRFRLDHLDAVTPAGQVLSDHQGCRCRQADTDPPVIELVEHLAVPAVLVAQHAHEPVGNQHG